MLRLQTPLAASYGAARSDELDDRITAAKAALGDDLFILGHHYQRDEVIAHADARGDSYRLSVLAQQRPEATSIVFCGVHFMAESADILTGDHQRVILPDLNAGCSMADMADIDEVEEAWEALAEIVDVDRVVPITYMNSSAALKAFVGRHGGAVCTSTNARAVLEWALGSGAGNGAGGQGDTAAGNGAGGQGDTAAGNGAGGQGDTAAGNGAGGQGDKVLFFPDQHLGRNTGVAMGYDLADMRVWDPRRELGGLGERDCKEATFLLWRGHCSIHQRFRPEQIEAFRAEHPDGIVVVHPEAPHETVLLADQVGSTDYIIKALDTAPAGATIAVGTEVHLVNRLAQEHPDKTVVSLDPLICPCSTMNRIDLPHLAWVLDELVEGRVVNQITVDADTAEGARIALERMLQIV
jgi:quinolinate synthase